jgi:hypothetical protein
MWQIAREGDGVKISLAFGFAFAIRVEQLEYGIVVPPARGKTNYDKSKKPNKPGTYTRIEIAS